MIDTNKYDAAINSSMEANVGNMFDLRAGPNSVSSMGNPQLSFVFNNRCYLHKLVDGIQEQKPLRFLEGGEPSFAPPEKSTLVRRTKTDLDQLQPWNDKTHIHSIDKNTIDNETDDYLKGRFGMHNTYKGLLQSYDNWDKDSSNNAVPKLYRGLGIINNLTHGISKKIKNAVDAKSLPPGIFPKKPLVRDDVTETVEQRTKREKTICKKIIFDLFNPYAEETFKGGEQQVKDAIELYSRIGCKTIHDPNSTGWLPDNFTYNDYRRKAGILKTSSPSITDEKDLFGDDVPSCQKKYRKDPTIGGGECAVPSQEKGELDVVNSLAEVRLGNDGKEKLNYMERKNISDLYNKKISQCQNIANIFGVTGSYHSFLDHAPCGKEGNNYKLKKYHTIPHRDCFISEDEKRSGSHPKNIKYSAFGVVMDTARKMYGRDVTLGDIDEYYNEHCIGHGLLSSDQKPYSTAKRLPTGANYLETKDPQHGIYSHSNDSEYIQGSSNKQYYAFADNTHKKKRPPKHLLVGQSTQEYKDRFGYKSSLFVAVPEENADIYNYGDTDDIDELEENIRPKPEPEDVFIEDDDTSKKRRINICRKIRHDSAHKDASGRIISGRDGKLSAIEGNTGEKFQYVNRYFPGRIKSQTDEVQAIGEYLKLGSNVGNEDWLRDGKHMPIPGIQDQEGSPLSADEKYYPIKDSLTNYTTIFGGPKSMPWAKILRDHDNKLLYKRLDESAESGNGGWDFLQKPHLIKTPHWQYRGENQNIGSLWTDNTSMRWKTDRGGDWERRTDYPDAPNSQCIVAEPSFTHTGNIKSNRDDFEYSPAVSDLGTSGGTFSCYSDNKVAPGGGINSINKAAPLDKDKRSINLHKHDGLVYYSARSGGGFERVGGIEEGVCLQKKGTRLANSNCRSHKNQTDCESKDFCKWETDIKPFPIGPAGEGETADGIGKPSDYVGGMREVIFAGERGPKEKWSRGMENTFPHRSYQSYGTVDPHPSYNDEYKSGEVSKYRSQHGSLNQICDAEDIDSDKGHGYSNITPGSWPPNDSNSGPTGAFCNVDVDSSYKLFKTFPSGQLLGSSHYEFDRGSMGQDTCNKHGCNAYTHLGRIDGYGGAIKKSNIRKGTTFWFNYFDPVYRSQWYSSQENTFPQNDGAYKPENKWNEWKTNAYRNTDLKMDNNQPRDNKIKPDWRNNETDKKYFTIKVSPEPDWSTQALFQKGGIFEPEGFIGSNGDLIEGQSDGAHADRINKSFAEEMKSTIYPIGKALDSGKQIITPPAPRSYIDLHIMGYKTSKTHPDMIQLMACNNQYGCDAPATNPLQTVWENMGCDDLNEDDGEGYGIGKSPNETFTEKENDSKVGDFNPSDGVPNAYSNNSNKETTDMWGPTACLNIDTTDGCIKDQNITGTTTLKAPRKKPTQQLQGRTSPPPPPRWQKIRESDASSADDGAPWRSNTSLAGKSLDDIVKAANRTSGDVKRSRDSLSSLLGIPGTKCPNGYNGNKWPDCIRRCGTDHKHGTCHGIPGHSADSFCCERGALYDLNKASLGSAGSASQENTRMAADSYGDAVDKEAHNNNHISVNVPGGGDRNSSFSCCARGCGFDTVGCTSDKNKTHWPHGLRYGRTSDFGKNWHWRQPNSSIGKPKGSGKESRCFDPLLTSAIDQLGYSGEEGRASKGGVANEVKYGSYKLAPWLYNLRSDGEDKYLVKKSDNNIYNGEKSPFLNSCKDDPTATAPPVDRIPGYEWPGKRIWETIDNLQRTRAWLKGDTGLIDRTQDTNPNKMKANTPFGQLYYSMGKMMELTHYDVDRLDRTKSGGGLQGPYHSHITYDKDGSFEWDTKVHNTNHFDVIRRDHLRGKTYIKKNEAVENEYKYTDSDIQKLMDIEPLGWKASNHDKWVEYAYNNSEN